MQTWQLIGCKVCKLQSLEESISDSPALPDTHLHTPPYLIIIIIVIIIVKVDFVAFYFFCKASVTDNVLLHTFGPYASMHHLYALHHPKTWQCGTFHCQTLETGYNIWTHNDPKIFKNSKLKINFASQRLLPVPRQLIWRGQAPVGEFYFGGISDENFASDIQFFQRLTIIESPTPDDYDYYDEFSQVPNTHLFRLLLNLKSSYHQVFWQKRE